MTKEKQDEKLVGYLPLFPSEYIPNYDLYMYFKKMFTEEDKKLVGYLAAPPIKGTPGYDSYMHFKKMFTDECKNKNIPSWRKIKGGHVE